MSRLEIRKADSPERNSRHTTQKIQPADYKKLEREYFRMRRADHVQKQSTSPEKGHYQVKNYKSNAQKPKIDILENQNSFGTLGRRGHNSSGFKPKHWREDQGPDRQVSRTTPLAGIDYGISTNDQPPNWIKNDSFKVRNQKNEFEQRSAKKRKISENSREFKENGQRVLKPRAKQRFANMSGEASGSDFDENVNLEEYSRKIQDFLSGRKASRERGKERNRGKSDGRRERTESGRQYNSITLVIRILNRLYL